MAKLPMYIVVCAHHTREWLARSGSVTTINRALTSETLAASGHQLEFVGVAGEDWGFAVDHSGDRKNENTTSISVDSIALPALKACLPPGRPLRCCHRCYGGACSA
jgi:hypothetical protein